MGFEWHNSRIDVQNNHLCTEINRQGNLISLLYYPQYFIDNKSRGIKPRNSVITQSRYEIFSKCISRLPFLIFCKLLLKDKINLICMSFLLMKWFALVHLASEWLYQHPCGKSSLPHMRTSLEDAIVFDVCEPKVEDQLYSNTSELWQWHPVISIHDSNLPQNWWVNCKRIISMISWKRYEIWM